MAECFLGRKHVVRFSNGAVETLYGAWVTLGIDRAQTAEDRLVVDWIRGLLETGAPGARAFRLDPTPPELSSPSHLRFLAELIAATATDILREQPTAMPSISWSDEMRISWLARLIELHDLVRVMVPMLNRPAPLDERLDFSGGMRVECTVERLRRRLDELLPSHRSDPTERITLIDEIISTIRDHHLERAKGELLAQLYSNRADAFLEKMNIREAVSSLRSSATFEQDAAIREATREYALELERKLDGA